MHKLLRIKITPLWSVWCLWVLAMTSLSTGAIIASSALAGGAELTRFIWHDMMADLKMSYWYKRLIGGE